MRIIKNKCSVGMPPVDVDVGVATAIHSEVLNPAIAYDSASLKRSRKIAVTPTEAGCGVSIFNGIEANPANYLTDR